MTTTPADEIKTIARTCATCGHPIKPKPGSRLGWTHTGSWEGMRCPRRVTGAAPIEKHLDYLAAYLDELQPEAQTRAVRYLTDRYREQPKETSE